MKTYETPAMIEVRMDAEIGSYQDEFEPARDVPEAPAFVRNEREVDKA